MHAVPPEPAAQALVRAAEQWDGGTLLVAADRTVVWVNAAFLALTGLPRRVVLGRPLADILRADGGLSFLYDIEGAVELGLDTSFVRPLRRDETPPTWIDVAFTVVRDAQGLATHFVARCTDVTSRREREAELRRMSMAIDASSQGIALLNASRVVVRANPAFARLHGRGPQDAIVGTSWFDLLAPHAALDRLHDAEFAVESQHGWSGTFALGDAEAGGRVVQHVITRLPDGGWIISASDQSGPAEVERNLVHARDLAEAAAEAQANFVAVVSHELRTPLNAVIGFSRLLLQRTVATLAVGERDLLQRIHDNGRSLLAIVDGILTHAKARAGRIDVVSAPTDVAAVVAEVVRDGADAARPGVALSCHTPPHVTVASVDPLRLHQVVTQLVRNATKFTEQGTITVRVVEDAGGGLSIQVADTGPGIAAEEIPRLFQPFEQGDRGPARRYGGTGLGLAIARALCAFMDLSLDVESQQGVGTTFRVGIPARMRLASTPAGAP